MDKIDLSRIDWYAILPRLGIDGQFIQNPRRTGPCPLEAGEGRTRFRFANTDGRGQWHCSQCGHGDGVRLVALVNGIGDAEAIRLIRSDGAIGERGRRCVPLRKQALKPAPDPVRVKRSLQRAWDGAVAVEGTFAQRYLERRVPGLQVAWLSDNLRAHGSMFHFDEQTRQQSRRPCLLARAVDAQGVPVTLHRMYLSHDGFKADVSVSQVKKQMTGVRGLDGDAIRLNSPARVSRVLIVCEGIETGLALVTATGNRHAVWALLDAGNLAKARVPRDRFDTVIIAADRDPLNPRHGWRVGEHCAHKLQARLKDEGFATRIRVPSDDGTDFADLWLERCRLRRVA